MSFEVEVLKYPEWRQLMASIKPLLETQTKFSYDELQQLSGLDIRGWKGRSQFYKFRRHALKEWQVWFEVIPRYGYAVIPAGEQPKAASKRVLYARRKVAMARAINGLARVENMTPEQRALQAQTAVLLHELSQTFNRVGRQFAAAASKLHLEVSAEDIKLIGDRKPQK
jgi:hypothetical protein